MEPLYTPFATRRITFLGVEELRARRCKLYSIVYGDGDLDLDRFEPGLELARDAMPGPEPARGRPGLGFLIMHQGKTGDYVVACWWDRENELPTRVFFREDDQWRTASDGESFCVWDLEIMWFERCAYVQTMLAPTGASPEAYLGASLPT